MLPYKNNSTRTQENFYPIFGDFFHTAIMDYALNCWVDTFFNDAAYID